MNLLSLILIFIVAILLYIIYKILTGTTIPNIDVKLDVSRKNSHNIKYRDDHRINIKIDESTHYHNAYPINNIRNNSTGDNDDSFASIILFSFCMMFVFTLYQRYIKYVNYCIISTPIIVSIIYICVSIFYRTKNILNIELIKYLFISLFTVLIIIISSLFPFFVPDKLNTLLTSQITPNIIEDFPLIIFVIFKLLGYGLHVFIIFCLLVGICRHYSYEKIRSSYSPLIIMTIICFLFTSGIVSKTLTFFQASIAL